MYQGCAYLTINFNINGQVTNYQDVGGLHIGSVLEIADHALMKKDAQLRPLIRDIIKCNAKNCAITVWQSAENEESEPLLNDQGQRISEWVYKGNELLTLCQKIAKAWKSQ